MIAFFLSLFFSALSYTFANETPFVSSDTKDLAAHITTNAQTGPVGSVSLERSPGANLNSELLLTSLSVVVFDRFELGTIPALYFEKTHRYNITAKLFFWKGEEFFWAFAGQYMDLRFDANVDYNNTKYPIDFQIFLSTLQLTMNYLPKNSLFSFGAAVSTTYTDIHGFIVQKFKDTRFKHDTGVDISYAVYDNIDVTLGLGFLRDVGLSAYEKSHFGFGSSVRWKRPHAFFSSPTFGLHYTPQTNNLLYLVSSKILWD